ncbi:hypothetical protein H6P81_011580 [Aristolochia fimbriata]|uniref:Bifunctional inhibitor/plant lipid transfer protein/seed storage helical domain-containing protein n=1 Tax=Aristolochia fimbriata TaxID=158543 RepID=A0AAV7EU74_ARIFI|nr:hypothetical protein H6P81_011580 [Aristolochia fimbriata]
MAKLLCVFFLLAAVVYTAQCATPAPVPLFPGCLTDYLTPLMDCMDYAAAGGNATKPNAECCKAYGEILKNQTSVDCLCDGLKHPGDSPIPLNATRMDALPTECKQPKPPCGNAVSPSPAPPTTPPSTPGTPSNPTPAVPATPKTPPTVTPSASGASSLSISAAFIFSVAASVASLF